MTEIQLSPIQQGVLERLHRGEQVVCQVGSVLDRQVPEMVDAGIVEFYEDSGERCVRLVRNEQTPRAVKRPITIEYRYVKATARYSLGAVQGGEMPEERFFGTYQQMVQAVEAVNPDRKVISI